MVLAHFDVIENSERIVGKHRQRAVQRDEIRSDRLAVDAHEPDRETWALLARQVRLVLLFSTRTLSLGTSGIPRQVKNGEPNIVTVGGGTPRRVHSRPKAAIARGWARKNAGSFHTRERSSSRSSGVGAPVRVGRRIDGAALLSRP